MKHLANYWKHAFIILVLILNISIDATAQLEIDNDLGETSIELIPATGAFDGSRIYMYQAGDGQGTQKKINIRLDAATSGSYGSLALNANTFMQPFGNANNNGIPSSGHPYSMIRLINDPVASNNVNTDYAWNFGIYNYLDFNSPADGDNSDDCVNCLTLSYETGGFAAFYKFTFGSNGDFSQASDERLKENISDVNLSLNKILKLSSKKYHYIWDNKKGSRKSTGFLAQDVQKVFPDLVTSIVQPNGEKTLMLDYIGMIPHITKGMQEQQDIISNQDEQITELRTMISQLSAQVKILQELNQK